MNIYALSALINLLTGASLCLAILSKEQRNKLDLKFAFFAFTACIWSGGYFFWQLSIDHSSALIWSKILMAGAIGIGATYFHFVIEFLNLSSKRKLLLQSVDVVFGTLFILNFGNLIVSGTEQRLHFEFWPIPGPAFHLFLIFWLATVYYSTLLLYKAYRSADGIFKKQIRYLFWGVLIGFLAGSCNYFLWYNIPIPPITNFFVCLYFILVFYAIVKYRFFNVKIIATEAFVAVLIGVTVWQFFISDSTTNIFLAVAFLTLVVIAGGFLIKSVLREVSQREQLQHLSAQLGAANEKLKTLDQARAEFISIASHQLRTPPATIKWYLAAILAEDFGKVSPDVKTQLEKAQRTNNGLISLIDDLLNVSRVERGKLEFMFEPIDIKVMVQQTIDQLTPQATDRKLKLVYTPPKSAIPLITADKEKLKQVFNNLVDNAIKYTKEGKVDVSLAKIGSDVVFKVKDSGKGVGKDEKISIFEKFGRGKDASKHSSGLGLGLYLAKIVVAQHKGKIWVESEGEGEGSTFVVSLPIKTNLVTNTFDFTKHQ